MYLGTFCEVGDANVIFERPAHPYTTALLSAVPEGLDERPGERVRIRLQGEPPSPLDPPSGCRFRTRCPYAQERCAVEVPALQALGDGREVACHFPFVAVGGATGNDTTQGHTET
jgi:peptide/nickel transport system ATP-binding protein